MKWLSQLFYSLCSTCRPNTSSTVRLAFPMLFMVAAAALGAATIVSEKHSYIKLVASTANIEAGKQFWVDVYAYAHTPVNAVDISLAFPKDQVEVIGIDTGQSVLTIWTEKPYVENGSVILRGGTFRRGFVGEHLIATVNMRGRATGIAHFETSGIRFLAGDGAGTEVPASSDSPVSLYIYDAENAPENITAVASLEIVTDLDGDGEVTLRDVSLFMSAWFGDKGSRFDFNNDGHVSFRDFSIILADSFFK